MKKLAFIISFVVSFLTSAGIDSIPADSVTFSEIAQNPTIYVLSVFTGLLSTMILEYFRDWLACRRSKRNARKLAKME